MDDKDWRSHKVAVVIHQELFNMCLARLHLKRCYHMYPEQEEADFSNRILF